MQFIKLVLKNLRGSGFKSIAILLAMMGVACLLMTTTLIIKGAEYSLDSGIKRLGADILVVPEGAESKLESALLMGKPTKIWMSEDYLNLVTTVPGVESVSPQIYLASLFNAHCCSVSEMFIIVYDPQTDFTVTPWLMKNLGRSLSPGEVVGGCYVFTPPGDKFIKLYGYNLTLKGTLSPTGTGLDQTMFMTVETARILSESSSTIDTMAEEPLVLPEGQISSIMVKVTPGFVVHPVAREITKLGLWPIESPKLFGIFRSQMNGLLWGFFILTIIIWVFTMVLIGIVFSMAANERRREMGVLRAVGATRNFVFRLILTEAAVLAISGAAIGISISAVVIYNLRNFIAGSFKMPFLFPSWLSFIELFGAGIALAIIAILLAALIPAYRISRHEPAIAMRE